LDTAVEAMGDTAQVTTNPYAAVVVGIPDDVLQAVMA